MSDLHVSWSEYNKNIEELACQIRDSGWKFNQIICIAKGGLRIGDIFCRLFDEPLAILSVESYSGAQNTERGDIIFSRDLAKTSPNLGSHVLLVDDLADSGTTLKKSMDWLKHFYGFYIEEIRTAVVWYKAISTFRPDYYVEYLEDSPWIHQPFEKYEQMKVDDLTPDSVAREAGPVS
ncbi:MAG: phosphoribosyltransferase family protein [bacterium]